MAAMQKTVSVQAYFNNKKSDSWDKPVGIADCNSMVFDNYGRAGNRGISSWQRAKFENWDQRAKQQKFYEDKRKLEQLKRKQEYEATKEIREAAVRKQQEERERELRMMKEIESQNRIVVDTFVEDCNDAW
jgi:hypothetical protein